MFAAGCSASHDRLYETVLSTRPESQHCPNKYYRNLGGGLITVFAMYFVEILFCVCSAINAHVIQQHLKEHKLNVVCGARAKS